MTAELAQQALLNSLINRNFPSGVIIHSDRGSQYNSNLLKEMFKKYGLKGSMGQVHTCADSASMESFNALLQKNVFNQKRVWNTRHELRIAIHKWVNVRYNMQRRQKSLCDMTPLEKDILYYALAHNCKTRSLSCAIIVI